MSLSRNRVSTGGTAKRLGGVVALPVRAVDAADEAWRAAPGTPPRRRGVLEGVTPEGRLLVSVGDSGPLEASFTLSDPHAVILDAVRASAAVLVDFVDGDRRELVVVGILRERLEFDPNRPEVATEPNLTLRAGERLTLACGAAAIELTADGRVAIRGAELVNESAGAVKIKGGYVEIN